ncbi:MAG TPA: hypothetical protein VFA45_05305 [Actinomycetes bacterium]|jgi:hypothetical protein|nr:hypothetical protein [Actinomycetes bacterium]
MADHMKDLLVLALRYQAEYHDRGFGLDGQCDWAHAPSDGHLERPAAEWTVWLLRGGSLQRHPVCRACHVAILKGQRPADRLGERELEGIRVATQRALQQALAAASQQPAPQHRLRGQVADVLADRLPHLLRDYRPRSKYEVFGVGYHKMVFVNERRDRATGAERVQLAFEVPLGWVHGQAVEGRLRKASLDAHFGPSPHGAARVWVNNLANVDELASVLGELDLLENGWRELRGV